MSRIILFKAKAVDGSGWVESMTLANGTIKRKESKLYMEIGGDNWKQVNPDTVCQFTGLTDKNGNKYFFDDIVKFKDGSIGVLIWFDDKLGIGSGEFNNYHAIDQTSKRELAECEIIGNIYDQIERP